MVVRKSSPTPASGNTSAPGGDESAAAPPSDMPSNPYDINSVRYEDVEYAHGDAHLAKIRAAMVERAPIGSQEFFQLHPGPDYRVSTGFYNRKLGAKSIGGDNYLVLPQVSHVFKDGGLVPVQLRLAVNNFGSPFLWGMKMHAADGVQRPYNIAMADIADRAEHEWIKIVWSVAEGAHRIIPAPDLHEDPQWPPLSMTEMLSLAFPGERLIASVDHPVVREYQGLKPL